MLTVQDYDTVVAIVRGELDAAGIKVADPLDEAITACVDNYFDPAFKCKTRADSKNLLHACIRDFVDSVPCCC